VVSGLSACWCSRNAGKGGYVAIGFRHTSPKRKRGSPPPARVGRLRLPKTGSVGRCDTRLVALLPKKQVLPFAQPLIFTPSTQLNSVHRTSAPGAGSRGRETSIYGQYAGNFHSVAAWYAARPAMGRRRSKARSKSANSSKCSVLSSRRTARLDAGVFLLKIFLNQAAFKIGLWLVDGFSRGEDCQAIEGRAVGLRTQLRSRRWPLTRTRRIRGATSTTFS
jgi:hypothetical protein